MSDADRMRMDVWMWRVRLFRTRGTAAAAVEAGVRLERGGQVRRIDKPATTVAPGDLISLATPCAASGAGVVRILSLPARRGPAPEAAACYEWLNLQQKSTGAL